MLSHYSDVYLTKDEALEQLRSMGYPNPSDIKIIPGNEYLTSLRMIAEGKYAGMDMATVQILVRREIATGRRKEDSNEIS